MNTQGVNYLGLINKGLVPGQPDEWQACQNATLVGDGSGNSFALLASIPPHDTSIFDGGPTWASYDFKTLAWGSMRYRIGLYWTDWAAPFPFGA